MKEKLDCMNYGHWRVFADERNAFYFADRRWMRNAIVVKRYGLWMAPLNYRSLEVARHISKGLYDDAYIDDPYPYGRVEKVAINNNTGTEF